ncbi:MAG: 2-succinyl-6-hydroxy-2,4-cyclohexadiene-1-carboxylate synthase [Candidatus Endonucleobacter sp. (ex Gigantidas childressi)]|nr:2-succinyl-6-hydroxy-2,4-cyclohexadiene-1-carboxylate synthase [Candidatus Endonucleobacter sp. (ex Gigantidas childressi)]
MHLSYKTRGLRSNPPLLLLHGFLGSATDWLLLCNNLGNDFYLIVLDLPGHGESADIDSNEVNPDPLISIHSLINNVLKRLSLKKVTLLGYSLGGRIAMGYALAHSNNINSLIIEAAHPGLKNDEEKKARAISDEYWCNRFCSEAYDLVLYDWYCQSVFKDISDNDRQQLIIERLVGLTACSVANVLTSYSLSKQPDYSEWLSVAPFPVHYLCGENDKAFSHIGKQLNKAGCLQSLHCIGGAGHNVHRERPEKVAAIIRTLYQLPLKT